MIGELTDTPPEVASRGSSGTLAKRYAEDAKTLQANRGQWGQLETKKHRPAKMKIMLALANDDDNLAQGFEIKIVSRWEQMSFDPDTQSGTQRQVFDIWARYVG